MVPMDYYPSRMFDESELQWLFKSAKEANYNLLRIWGGGVYLNDRFYELADQYGIMVWQDMMFSCRFYPMLDEDYTRNANIEVRENVGRI